MKAIIIMLAIVAIIWALNGYTCAFISSSSDEMLSSIDKVKHAVESEDQNGAGGQIDDLRSEWEAVESRWEVLVDHREVDRIDTLMTHIEGMAKAGTLDTMMPELDELAFFFTHINDKHKLKVENIF
jgi:hypothetical protein